MDRDGNNPVGFTSTIVREADDPNSRGAVSLPLATVLQKGFHRM